MSRLSLHAGSVQPSASSSSYEPRMARRATGRVGSRGTHFARPPLVTNEPLHVEHDGQKWVVRLEGSREPLMRVGTKRKAMRRAREEAESRGVDLVEHYKDGRVKS